MVELGCAKKSDLENDISNEFKKIEEIWMFLYLCSQKRNITSQQIFISDLKILLMAIFGIKGNKRLGGEPVLSDLPLGYIHEGDLHLSNLCIEALRSKFSILNSNRIINQG